ncbi:MAG TPA: ATP-dependent DNA ligase [Steroidobacteraceae bacterium]|nr:ATP-dependent DNA ligase [Steroidobacteraceae bacterium]
MPATRFDLPLTTAPMEASLARELPGGPTRWQYEPKWDGFRCLAFRAGPSVELRAKSGKSLTRYFPEIVQVLAQLRVTRFVLDGELLIERRGQGDFAALQNRLHPAATRVQRLSQQTPAKLMLFDVLSLAGKRLLERPLRERRALLEDFVSRVARGRRAPCLSLSPVTTQLRTAQHWLTAQRKRTDGVVAKSLDQPYCSGERAMVKVKPIRSADCVVGGFRYASSSREVGSLLLGLYDEKGRLNHVGFTSAIAHAERAALTRRLEALREPPGFTGRSPGGPSRWSTERSSEWQPLKPILVVEVSFDQVTADRFRHGTRLLRWRPDKAARQCTFEQIR